jgi:Tfp pilus assembly protein PilE
MNRRLNSQLGLTLPEVLIIVVIIGLLAAVAIPNYFAMRNRDNDLKTRNNMSKVMMALENQARYEGTYPFSNTEFGRTAQSWTTPGVTRSSRSISFAACRLARQHTCQGASSFFGPTACASSFEPWVVIAM